MDGERFITRPMSIALDGLRFLAALGVLAVHAAEQFGRIEAMPFTPRLSHYCVIVFFVLSGLVIADSATRKHTDLRGYAAARLARIGPVAVPAVLFAALAQLWLMLQAGPLPPGTGPEGLRALLSSLLFLTQSPLLAAPTWGNHPYWSLCYEVWYYALFGAGLFLRGGRRILAMIVLAVLAGPNILLLFPLWLGGAWLNTSRWARSLTARQGVLYLAGCAALLQVLRLFDLRALLWLRDAVPFSFGMSEWLLSDYPLALVVMLALAALRPLAGSAAAWLARRERQIRGAAGMSFSLYLFHFPLLLILERFSGALPQGGGWVLVPIAAVLALCTLIARLTERRSPKLRRWLESRWDGRGDLRQAAAA